MLLRISVHLFFCSMVLVSCSRRLVFLGTPEVAAISLQMLLASPYEVVSVVTQPPAPAGRNKKLTMSPVHLLAIERQIPVLHPESAKDSQFLAAMETLAPDLCVTVEICVISDYPSLM
jgi:methionyl-tRNA formyltransferase